MKADADAAYDEIFMIDVDNPAKNDSCIARAERYHPAVEQ